MKCCICGSNTRIAHHLSYEPEVTTPICYKHHKLIHYGFSLYGSLFYLNPAKAREWVFPEDISSLEWIPEELRHYACIASKSKYKYRKDRGSWDGNKAD